MGELHDEVKALSLRLAAVERRNCRLRAYCSAFAAITILLALSIGGATSNRTVHAQQAEPTVHDTLVARRIILVNDANRPRAILGMNPQGGPSFILLDDQEKSRISMNVTKGTLPQFMITTDEGELEAVLGLSDQGTPQLVFFKKGSRRPFFTAP